MIQPKQEPEPVPDVRVNLSDFGLPKDFFSREERSPTIIEYRFAVWVNNEHVVVGFNTKAGSRPPRNGIVEGSARLLTFGTDGALKAQRDVPYSASGYDQIELVAEGEARPGPSNTLLLRIQGTSLQKDGLKESPSGVLLLDADLRDVARIDRFLDQTTFVNHALVFQEPITGQPYTFDVLDGSPPRQTRQSRVDWPVNGRDHHIGEHGLAYVTCLQELRENEYTPTGIVYAGAKHRCKLNVTADDQTPWEASFKDGENADLLGLLADGSVVGHLRGGELGNAGSLVIWKKDHAPEVLPWIPPNDCGEFQSATRDMSRYAAFATCDDSSKSGRWMVFDRRSPTPLVNRRFPKNGRAALSPDGLHYASFESGELHIYSLPR